MATPARRRKFPTSLNGGEQQDPDDVRVGETHVKAPEGFERVEASDRQTQDTGPDSEFDSSERADERLEQRDEPDAGRAASQERSPRESTDATSSDKPSPSDIERAG